MFKLFLSTLLVGSLFWVGTEMIAGPQSDFQSSLGQDEYYFGRIIDGDTVELNNDVEQIRVRLLGLNTPEAYDYKGKQKECFGFEASQAAQDFFKSQSTVLLERDPDHTIDAYDRVLGYISADGVDFSSFMISEGFGFEYTYAGRSYLNQELYRKLQKKALSSRKGLWSDASGCQYR